MAKYEDIRISDLQMERLIIQKKTFTKWTNMQLQRANTEKVNDIFIDLSDGIQLWRLLEIVSGEKLGTPTGGKTRLHRFENVNRCLAFLCEKRFRIEGIGSEDIVDGNPKLILGLLFRIILWHLKLTNIDMQIVDEMTFSDDETFDKVEQVKKCEEDKQEEREQVLEEKEEISEKELQQNSEKSEEKISPKLQESKTNSDTVNQSITEALMRWCKRQTQGYAHVNVIDFSGSWQDGMAFNALLHSYRPELIDFESLDPGDHIANLNNAFRAAADHLEIPALLDAEDVNIAKPDEQSIITYLSSVYHHFSKIRNLPLKNKKSDKQTIENKEKSAEKFIEPIDTTDASILAKPQNEKTYPLLWIIEAIVLIIALLLYISPNRE